MSQLSRDDVHLGHPPKNTVVRTALMMNRTTHKSVLTAILLALYILGFVATANAAIVTASFSSATDVAVTGTSYTATGNSVDLSLNYAPVTGTTLTIVKNTGLGFIDGTFSNLAQGQIVVLPFGGATYVFVANYFGGTGNDLVLQWYGTRAMAWGTNDWGQLGNGTVTNSPVPIAVSKSGVLAGKTVTASAAGAFHSLALCSDGSLAAWGRNESGELGNNSTTTSFVPVAVTATGVLAGKTVVAIAAGNRYSVALCSDGTVASWGYNANGQLGNNSTISSPVPVSVVTTGVLSGKTVVAIATGYNHTLALCSDSTVVAWGSNFTGQLGNNSTTDSLVPVAVTTTGVLSGKTVIMIAAGATHSMALASNGTAFTWGGNIWGQLGNNSTVDSLVPVAASTAGVLAGKTVTAIAGGDTYSVALASDGTLAAWGKNLNGQLGNNSTTTSLLPAAVIKTGALSAKTITSIGAGDAHALALCSDGTLATWGANFNGQLGNNTTTESHVPVTVSTTPLAAGERFTTATSGAFANHSLSLVAPPPSSNSLLSGLAISAGTLSPAFVNSTSAYTVTVPDTTATLQLTPTVADTFASVKVNGASVTSGTASANVDLSYGDTTITTVVTAANGTTRTYTITVTRPLGTAMAIDLNSPTSVPVIGSSFNASGRSATISLNFAPTVGSALTIVKNTGIGFITGRFTNLAQGQSVALTFGGDTYTFIANYYGGTGNDLVLQWAGSRAIDWGFNNRGQLGNNGTADSLVPVTVSASGVLSAKTVVGVSVGASHSLALCSDGTIASWGFNSNGQLGNNSTTLSQIPVAVAATGTLFGKTVIATAAGANHSMALCSDGTVASWGANANGQLGNNSTTDSTVPVAVSATGVLSGKTVVAIAAGDSHSMALCSDGTLATWGLNSSGQLGNNSTTQSSVPVAVNTAGVLTGKTAIAIAAGNAHSIAVLSNGTVATWGGNTNGQLGNNSTTQSLIPVLATTTGVLAGKTVVAAAAGANHSLALCSDGTVATWGLNSSGQLGNNGSLPSQNPVAITTSGVLSGKTVVSISSGANHCVALCSDGTLASWGDNIHGQLGNNSFTNSPTPVAVNNGVLVGNDRFAGIATGSSAIHSLAYVSASLPTYHNSLLLSLVPSISALAPGFSRDITAYTLNVSEIVTSIRFTPTISESHGSMTINGSAITSGATSGAISLGYGDTIIRVVVTAQDNVSVRSYTVIVSRALPGNLLVANFPDATTIPLTVAGMTAPGTSVNLSLGYAPVPGTNLTVLKNAGLDFIKGSFNNLVQGQNVTLSFGGTTYYFVANYFGGNGNDLVLQWANTRLMEWGSNTYGQLGTNSTTDSLVPTAVTAGTVLDGRTVISVAAGDLHTLALCSDGTLVAWGANSDGQLGNNATADSLVPVTITGNGVLAGRTVVGIAAGYSHSLALCSDGTVAAWGSNSNGQLGNNSTVSSSVPIAINSYGVLSGRAVLSVEAGGSHSLALCSDGTVATWGANFNGQLGNNTTTESHVPVAVSSTGVLSGKTVVTVTAGAHHSLALCSDGTLASWGANFLGQLGNNSITQSLIPVAVNTSGALSGKTINSVAAGYDHSLVVCSDGTLAAWGGNADGQLGNGTTTDSPVPVAVTKTGVLTGKTPIAVAAGGSHSLGLCSDGTLTAWGYNGDGQLGNNSTDSSFQPVIATYSLPALGRFISVSSGISSAFSIGIVAQLPVTDNTLLTSLIPSVGALSPVFSGNTTTYTITVPSSSASIQFTPTVADNYATLKVNGASVTSGTASPSIPLPFSDTIVNIVVTARDGTTTRTYSVTVTRPLPNNTLTANFGASTDVPLTTSAFTGTGNSVNLTLSYAPVPGTQLTLVKNTGLNFIKGTFSNLAQGQKVLLTFGGEDYQFVANYYGGNGNDLVLNWAGTKLMGWGDNSVGQLGNNTTLDSHVPTLADMTGALAGTTVTAVAGGLNHNLALCSDGSLVSWGSNSRGQLGNNSNTDSLVPLAITSSGILAGKTAIAITAGESHSLALCSDGTLAAWGDNSKGQLGNNTQQASIVPTAIDTTTGVLAGKTVIAIAAGQFHSMVLCSDGTVATWGLNSSGQLGNNSTVDSSTPVAVNTSGVLAGKRIISIAAGYSHNLALCSDGTLVSWGDNTSGQLGNNSNLQAVVPVAVTSTGVLAGKAVSSLSAGFGHSLALCSDGTLAAWGANDAGQLGNNSTTPSSVPIAVDNTGVLSAKTAVAVMAGYRHSLALCSDGSLTAWGANDVGQLGNNSTTNSLVPVPASTASLAVGDRFGPSIAGPSSRHSMSLVAPGPPSYQNALLTGLSVNTGTLAPAFAGNTTAYTLNVTASTASIQVTPTVAQLNATVKVNGTTAPSGTASGDINLGYGDTVIPIVVTAPDGITTRTYRVTVSRALPGNSLSATFSAATDVPLTAAGLNATGNSVDIALTYAPAPGTALTIVKNTGLNFIKGVFSNLSQGQKVALTFASQTYYFTANYFGGSGNDLVLQWSGTRLMEWGRNSYGQLGDNTTSDGLVPVSVKTNGLLAGKTIFGIGGGGNHTLAICSDATLAAWGDNFYGQLGNGTTTASHVPVAVSTLGVLASKQCIAVAAGDRHSLVLCSDGTISAWGDNTYGQLGNNSNVSSSLPVAVDSTGVLSGKTVVAIAAGNHHNLALCSDGTMATWGSNDHGQLGRGTGVASPTPVPVKSTGALVGKNVASIAAGGDHCLALCADGTLVAWGFNGGGQSGNGSTIDRYEPVIVASSGVLAGKTVISIAAGEAHNLALCSDGTLVAWGTNASGQLGNNTTTNSPVPVVVNATGVLAGKTVTSIAAGDRHSLALCSDGTLTTWGSNIGGQLGNNSTTFSMLPVMVSTASFAANDRFVGVGAGALAYHSLGLVAAASPHITITGNNISIPPADITPAITDGTDFGTVMQLDAQVARTFTVANTGAPFLNLTGSSPIAISGIASADFKVTAQPASSLDANEFTSITITFDPTLPGQRTATVTIASNDLTTPSFTFDITGFSNLPTKLPQTIDFAPPATVYLNESPLTLSASSSAGLPVTFSLISGPATLVGNTLTLTSAGIVKVQAASAASGNYAAATSVQRSITVNANPTALTLINLRQTYDGKPKPVGTIGGSAAPTITYKIGTTEGPTAPIAAGSYAVKAIAGTATATGTLVIAKAPLYATPDDKRKFAGQANPPLSVSYSGFVNCETTTVITKAPVLVTTATVTSTGGTYPITASGATALNYNFIYRQGTLVVESFAGNYEALLEDVNPLPVGKLSVTVTNTSKTFTAKLASTTETTAIPFTGTLVTSGEQATGTATALVGTAKTPYVISFTIPLYGPITATATRNSTALGSTMSGQKVSTASVLYSGAHTAVFEPATPIGAAVPAGAGWATASIGTTGVITLTGKLGDGTAFTTTLNPDVLTDPGYRMFIQPYVAARAQSFMAGAFTLEPHPSLPNRRYVPQSALTWTKVGLAADPSYRAGFGPVTTVLMLDPWLPPTLATKTAGAITLADRLGLAGPSISFTAVHSATGSASQAKLPTSLILSAANLVTVQAPVTIPTNATKWTTTFVPATGTFTGGFELVDGTLKRAVTFSGVLRQPAMSFDSLIGDGHFLLPPLTGTEKSACEIMFQRP